MREGPGADYPTLGQVARDDVLDVVGRDQQCAWLQVITPDGLTGWVSGDARDVALQLDCYTLPRGAFRPPTGIVLPNAGSAGLGELTVNNDLGTGDGLAVLTRSGQPVLAAYVRNKERFTLTGISDGRYELYFSLGVDWDGRRFTREPSYARFEEAFVFETTSTTYTTFDVTLYGVAGGTASTPSVPEDEFPVIGEGE